LLDLQDLAHDCEMLRLPADSSTMKRSPGFSYDDHLAKGADLVQTGIGAGVGQKTSPALSLMATQ
jgi:hypothetical protein